MCLKALQNLSLAAYELQMIHLACVDESSTTAWVEQQQEQAQVEEAVGEQVGEERELNHTYYVPNRVLPVLSGVKSP